MSFISFSFSFFSSNDFLSLCELNWDLQMKNNLRFFYHEVLSLVSKMKIWEFETLWTFSEGRILETLMKIEQFIHYFLLRIPKVQHFSASISKLFANFLLTFNFKLSFFAVLLKIHEETDDKDEKHTSDGSTSDACSFKHHSRPTGCEQKEICKFSFLVINHFFIVITHPNMIHRDLCSHNAVQCIHLYIRNCRELLRQFLQRNM